MGTANPFLVTKAPWEGDDDSLPLSNVDTKNTSVEFLYTSVLRGYGQNRREALKLMYQSSPVTDCVKAVVK